MSTIVKPLEWLGLSRLAANEIRIEDAIEQHRYVVRAELPGVDPSRDIRVVSTAGEVRLEVNRPGRPSDATRSEFHYGASTRSIPLPAAAVAETLAASYDRGILEITVTLAEPGEVGRVIPVRTSGEVPGRRPEGDARAATPPRRRPAVAPRKRPGSS
jgi:HSP20 family protein